MARPRSQEDLIACLDDQEQKPFLRVAPIDETVEAFDPLYRRRGADDSANPCESKKSMIVVKEAFKEEVLGYGEPANGVLL